MSVGPNDLATIIYTSGTTGEPKGVMLTHDNIYSNVRRPRAVSVPSRTTSRSRFLPLCHIFERMGGLLVLRDGHDDRLRRRPSTPCRSPCRRCGRRIVLSVPRLYEKMYARVLENALAGGAVKKQIFFWARAVADRWADEKLAGREPRAPARRCKYALAQQLVFSKLKARTGGRLRYFVSGGAPLAPEINKFFYAAGLTILEGYGLTETSPVIGVNTPANFRIGTVGKPIAGVEVTDRAATARSSTRGPHVMKGYYNKPEATAEAIDAERLVPHRRHRRARATASFASPTARRTSS